MSFQPERYYPVDRVRRANELLQPRALRDGQRLNWAEVLNIFVAATAEWMTGTGGHSRRTGTTAEPDEVRHMLRIMQSSEQGRLHVLNAIGPFVSDTAITALVGLTVTEKEAGRYPPPDEEVPHG